GFNCFAVNVAGDGIPTSSSLYADIEGATGCTYPGVTSGLVPASKVDAIIQLSVPSGSERTVQVVGVQSTQGCPPDQKLADVLSAPFITGIYEVGRTVTDIFLDSVVEIRNAY